MRGPSAIEVALTLVEKPGTVRQVSRSPLPGEVTFLLQVAAGEPDALRAARTKTWRAETALRSAAGFFIEQILFSHHADSYRILGGSVATPRSELRKHMALLMKWLHPDGHEKGISSDIDRGVFIHRVTQAWEKLKTDERRAAYDLSLAGGESKPKQRQTKQPNHQIFSPKPSGKARLSWPVGGPVFTQKSDRRFGPRRLVISRMEGDSLLNRLLFYLQGRV